MIPRTNGCCIRTVRCAFSCRVFIVLAVSLLAVFPFVYAFGYYPSGAPPLFQNAPAFGFWIWVFVIFSSLAIFGQDVASFFPSLCRCTSSIVAPGM
jgi:hypothetical protein